MGFQYYHHEDNKINQTKDLNNIIDGDLTTSSYSILNIEHSYIWLWINVPLQSTNQIYVIVLDSPPAVSGSVQQNFRSATIKVKRSSEPGYEGGCDWVTVSKSTTVLSYCSAPLIGNTVVLSDSMYTHQRRLTLEITEITVYGEAATGDLSAGETALIVLGVVVLTALCSVLCWWRQKQRNEETGPEPRDPISGISEPGEVETSFHEIVIAETTVSDRVSNAVSDAVQIRDRDENGIPAGSEVSKLSPPSYQDSISVRDEDVIPSYEDVMADSITYARADLGAAIAGDIHNNHNSPDDQKK